jgi:hypothetical protein
MPNTSQADVLKNSDLLLAAAEVYKEEPGVGDLMIQLADATGGAKEALFRRNSHRGQQQQASRDLDQLLITVKSLSERLRFVVKGRFGPAAERLAEFGLLPRRPPAKPKPKENPPEQAQSATQAATPAADSTT